MIVTLLAMTCSLHGVGQECDQQLNSARRAYYSGNLESVIDHLSNCIQHGGIAQEDQEEALKLLINSYLILHQDSMADHNMQKLLQSFPLTRVRSSDLVQYKRLFDTYEVLPHLNMGFLIGLNISDFEIMQYRSYASFREEPDDYDSQIAPSMGISGEYRLWKDLYLALSLVYQNHKLSFGEVLLDLQELKVRESMHYLYTPLVLKYVIDTKPVSFYLAGGINPHFVLSSKADFTILELDRDFPPPIFGNSAQVENYNLAFQRRKANYSYTIGLGLKKQVGHHALEIGAYYDYGLNNLVQTEERYTNEFLLKKFSYVPDDFKMNNYRFVVGIYRTLFMSKMK